MARLFAALIRHGDYAQLANTPSAHQPFPLTDKGRDQAYDAARQVHEALEKNAWSLIASIDSSRLLRGWQTAQLIGDGLQSLGGPETKVESFDALAERSVGSAANLSVEQIVEAVRQDPRYPDPPSDWKANSRYRLPLPGAESLLEAGERVAAHMRERMRRLRAEVVSDSLKLFVGHGAAFRHAAFQLGVLEFEQIGRLSMYHARPVFLEYSDAGPWRHVLGEWKLRVPDNGCLD
jgi:2,3-bisphosphoglycerate-dependent phosphoglycerate mutase